MGTSTPAILSGPAGFEGGTAKATRKTARLVATLTSGPGSSGVRLTTGEPQDRLVKLPSASIVKEGGEKK